MQVPRAELDLSRLVARETGIFHSLHNSATLPPTCEPSLNKMKCIIYD